ncbi:MAG TPA: site-2 protease family protein [Bryobacteraceae bacterium]|nr:site-2 protease family protein [Bryobacteraceae bacterium]
MPAIGTRDRYWLHALLFLLTLFTTTLVGAGMQMDFDRNLPLDLEHDLDTVARLFSHPALLWQGLPFSLTLLIILLAHEFGHYLACVYYRVDASLPYFLPAPTLTGTFGAFIRIRSAIYSRRVLFDIGVAGPVAGFVFLLPALAVGLAFSKIIPGIAHQGAIQFGAPLLQRLLQAAIFPGVPGSDIYLHPVARAAWIGILATALNLLPIGQLDGGHILYALAGDKHKLISKVFILLLVPLGVFYWWVWLFWAAILFWLGRRHPVIYDTAELGAGRVRLGYTALVIFVLCFTLAPVSTTGL